MRSLVAFLHEMVPMITTGNRKGGILAGWLVLLALTSCTPGPRMSAVQSQIPPIPAGMGRVWFLRQYRPMASQNMPMISVNGVPFARSEHASVFYHDFPPGTYHFTVESYGWDYNQDTTLRLTAGMQPFLEIETEREYVSGDQTTQDTFYVRPLPFNWASKYFSTISYLGAR
jgi:hypothetical protein